MQNELNRLPQQGVGLNLDTVSSKVQPGQITFALNSLISNFDGKEISYQNEEENTLCIDFPEGSKVIGRYNITQINKVIYFLTNPETKESEIGETNNNNCKYNTIISGECLNFSDMHPIHQIVVKTTNCSVEVYFTDSHNSMRFLNLNDLPWREIPDPNNEFKKIKVIGELDCNKMLVQPIFSIPSVDVISVEEGGNLKTGAYQFVVQYANFQGESYTSFYNVSNPISINQKDRATQDFDLPTNKSIKVKVSGLDTSGVFDYFNLVVVETINAISTPRLVGTYPISNTEYDIPYAGNTAQAIQISPEELFQRFQHYDKADGVTQSDDRIIWYNLREDNVINYQPIVSQVKVFWGTHKIPYTESEGYNNPMNTYLYKGLMRDEIYPIEIAFITKNGKQTDAWPTVGREAELTDLQSVDNLDANNTQEDKCQDFQQRQRWQVYNTGSLGGYADEYEGHQGDNCYKGPYQWGNMAFWESEETYPINKDIWGDLAGQKIRHHKLPDELITPRFSVEGDTEFIYPIGIIIDADSLYAAIRDSDLTQEQKDDIVGFKVIRGDRSSGNMSVRAKGHFTNVGKYNYEEQDYYFPNYPYNSLEEDPLFAIKEVEPNRGFDFSKALQPFKGGEGKDRFTFHSPDTHFGRVESVDTGFVKIESIDYGKGKGHFEQIKENAEYKFTTPDAVRASAALATAVAFDISKGGKPSFNGSDWAQLYTNMNELFEKLIAYQNFGYNITSTANFNKSYAVPNNGNKIRGINYGKYLIEGFNTIDQGNYINNYNRESSVFLQTADPLLYATEYSTLIPKDNSRFIASYQDTGEKSLTLEEFFELVRTNNLSAAIALVFGIRAAVQDISGGSENLNIILTQLVALIVQQHTDYDNLSGLKEFENADSDCLNIGEVAQWSLNVGYTYGANSYSFNNSSIQRGIVIDSDGEVILEEVDYQGGTVANNVIGTIFSNQNIDFNYSLDEVQLTIEQSAALDAQMGPKPPLFTQTQWDSLKGLLAKSLYGAAIASICGGDILKAAYQAIVQGLSAYRTIGPPVSVEKMSKLRDLDVNAYYGSLKADMPSQWGRIGSYTTVDTGFYHLLKDEDGKAFLKFPTIFGGDTFINKFSFKTKLPVFNKTTVGKPTQMDIALDENGNLGNPMFWISTKPLSYDYELDQDALQTSLGAIGVTVTTKVIGSLAETIGTVLMTAGLGLSATGVLIVPGLIVTAVGGVVYVLGKVFSNKAAPIEKAAIKLFKDLITQIINTLGIKNINLDMQRKTGIASQGVFYQYVYGIPTYFVESQVNVDYRQATNDNEGNFYPRVGTGIPDDWLQEARVPIINDNNYTYNKSFSKQNRENLYTHLREDYDFSKLCNTEFPNRAFWSEKTNLNETLNNWLIYKPVSNYDFPKSFGKLTSLDGVLNKQVIARFENKTQIYNALTTVNTSTFQAYLGNDRLFSGTPPVDLSETDTGSLGSQHKFLLKTPRGIVFTDAKRGQVILLQGTQPTLLSDIGLNKWFGENLKFFIHDKFPQVPIDNNYRDFGLHGVYDEFYDRLILTKKDYMPLSDDLVYENGDFFIKTITKKVIQVKESAYQSALPNEQIITNSLEPVSFYTWGIYGALVFAPGVSTGGIGSYTHVQNPYYVGKVNGPDTAAIWAPGNPLFVWAGFDICIDIPAAKTYHVLIAGDNYIRVIVNGQPVLVLDDDQKITQYRNQLPDPPFTFEAPEAPVYQVLTVVPVFLNSGSNRLSIQVLNAGGPGMLVGEIYDNSAAEVISATSDSDLNIVFTTKGRTNFDTVNYSCEEGWELIVSGNCTPPYCRQLFDSYVDKEVIEERVKKIELDDEKYFKNKSWTVSFSFYEDVRSWISWHSYLANYYIPQTDYFQSSLNKGTLWDHNKSRTGYTSYYGKSYPHIIEYPYSYKLDDEVLQSVSSYTTALKYLSYFEYMEPDENIFFNKAIVYNRQQNSGLLKLVPKPMNDLRAYMTYPKFNSDNKEILVAKTDNMFSFNNIRDITRVKGGLNILDTKDPTRSNLQLNAANLDYQNRSYNYPLLRAKDCRVRLILDDRNDYKLISHFMLTTTQISHL